MLHSVSSVEILKILYYLKARISAESVVKDSEHFKLPFFFFVRILLYKTFRKENSMDKKMMELNDADLENVSGGARREIDDLRSALRIYSEGSDINIIKRILHDSYGIDVRKLSEISCIGNEYLDLRDGHMPMTHEEVIERIKSMRK